MFLDRRRRPGEPPAECLDRLNPVSTVPEIGTPIAAA
jgi:hypothetical protein